MIGRFLGDDYLMRVALAQAGGGADELGVATGKELGNRVQA